MCGVKCKTAVVTGASSGIGREITARLLKEGFKVYGIGRNFKSETAASGEIGFLDVCAADGRFVPIVVDMLNTGKFYEQMRLLSKKEAIGCLINNAGTAYYGPHETLNPVKIHDILGRASTNTLTNLNLHHLRRAKFPLRAFSVHEYFCFTS